jgi:hypothetical protein
VKIWRREVTETLTPTLSRHRERGKKEGTLTPTLSRHRERGLLVVRVRGSARSEIMPPSVET